MLDPSETPTSLHAAVARVRRAYRRLLRWHWQAPAELGRLSTWLQSIRMAALFLLIGYLILG